MRIGHWPILICHLGIIGAGFCAISRHPWHNQQRYDDSDDCFTGYEPGSQRYHIQLVRWPITVEPEPIDGIAEEHHENNRGGNDHGDADAGRRGNPLHLAVLEDGREEFRESTRRREPQWLLAEGRSSLSIESPQNRPTSWKLEK